jgi:hypothetical protein
VLVAVETFEDQIASTLTGGCPRASRRDLDAGSKYGFSPIDTTPFLKKKIQASIMKEARRGEGQDGTSLTVTDTLQLSVVETDVYKHRIVSKASNQVPPVVELWPFESMQLLTWRYAMRCQGNNGKSGSDQYIYCFIFNEPAVIPDGHIVLRVPKKISKLEPRKKSSDICTDLGPFEAHLKVVILRRQLVKVSK